MDFITRLKAEERNSRHYKEGSLQQRRRPFSLDSYFNHDINSY